MKLYTQLEIDELEKEFKRTSAQFLTSEDLKRFFKSRYEIESKILTTPAQLHFDLLIASVDSERAFDLWFQLYFDHSDNFLITDKSAKNAFRSLFPEIS